MGAPDRCTQCRDIIEDDEGIVVLCDACHQQGPRPVAYQGDAASAYKAGLREGMKRLEACRSRVRDALEED